MEHGENGGRARLYRLNATGRQRLLTEFSGPGGRKRFLDAVESVDRRTAAKIIDGEGVLYSKLESTLVDLDLILERRDAEAVSNGNNPLNAERQHVSPAPHPPRPVSDRRPTLVFRVVAIYLIALFFSIGGFVFFSRSHSLSSSVAATRLTLDDLIKRAKALDAVDASTDSKLLREQLRVQAEAWLKVAAEAANTWNLRDEEAALGRLRSVNERLQWALQWMVKNDPASAIEMGGHLVRYWFVRDELERRQPALELATVHQANVAPLIRASALRGAALSRLLLKTPNLPIGLKLVGEAATIFRLKGAPRDEGRAVRLRALFHNALNQPELAKRDFDLAESRARETDDRVGLGLVHLCRSFAVLYPHSRRVHLRYQAQEGMKALHIFRIIGNQFDINRAFEAFLNATMACRYEDANRELYLEAERQCRLQIDDYKSPGNPHAELRPWQKFSRLALRRRDRSLLIECLIGLSNASDLGNVSKERYYKVYGAALHHAGHTDQVKIWKDSLSEHPDVSIHPARQQSLIERGKKLSLEDAVKLALGQE